MTAELKRARERHAGREHPAPWSRLDSAGSGHGNLHEKQAQGVPRARRGQRAAPSSSSVCCRHARLQASRRPAAGSPPGSAAASRASASAAPSAPSTYASDPTNLSMPSPHFYIALPLAAAPAAAAPAAHAAPLPASLPTCSTEREAVHQSEARRDAQAAKRRQRLCEQAEREPHAAGGRRARGRAPGGWPRRTRC